MSSVVKFAAAALTTAFDSGIPQICQFTIFIKERSYDGLNITNTVASILMTGVFVRAVFSVSVTLAFRCALGAFAIVASVQPVVDLGAAHARSVLKFFADHDSAF